MVRRVHIFLCVLTLSLPLGAATANPLAPPGAKLKGAPPAGAVGKPMRVVPGEPQQLKWVPTSKGNAKSPAASAVLQIDSGRVVAGPNEQLLGLSPDGDAAALADGKGRVRVLQLLNGRVSPFLPVAKGTHVSLAVSGFAAVVATGETLSRIHTWTGKPLYEAKIAPATVAQWAKPASAKWRTRVGAFVVAPGARHAAVVVTRIGVAHRQAAAAQPNARCVRIYPLGGNTQVRSTCWSEHGASDAHLVFSDDGAHLWVVTQPGEASGTRRVMAIRVISVDTSKVVAKHTTPASAQPASPLPGSGDADATRAAGERHAPTSKLRTVGGHRSVVLSQGASRSSGSSQTAWRFDLNGNKLTTTALRTSGRSTAIRGSRSWVSVNGQHVVVRSPGAGFVEDATRLPLRGAVTLADDGLHASVRTNKGLLFWDIARARAIAWLPGAKDATLARSRALWRGPEGQLRSATWVQLGALLPRAEQIQSSDSVLSRAALVSALLTR